MNTNLIVVLIILISLIFIMANLMSALKIIKETERMVVFLLGRYRETRGPGMIFILPFLEKGVLVPMQEYTLDLPLHTFVSKDNQLVTARIIAHIRVIDPAEAVLRSRNRDDVAKRLIIYELEAIITQQYADDVVNQQYAIKEQLSEMVKTRLEEFSLALTRLDLPKLSLDTEDIIGKHGRVVEALKPIGIIQIGDAQWSAVADMSIEVGSPVMVIERTGLQLYVEPLIEKSKNKHKR